MKHRDEATLHPCTTNLDVHFISSSPVGLAHDAQQFSEHTQKAQSTEEALSYMKFYLMRFAALIESPGATRKG